MIGCDDFQISLSALQGWHSRPIIAHQVFKLQSLIPNSDVEPSAVGLSHMEEMSSVPVHQQLEPSQEGSRLSFDLNVVFLRSLFFKRVTP